jgi:release factor glutamine methyltransferase
VAGKIVGEILAATGELFRARGVENPRLDAEVLLAHVLNAQRIDLYVDYARPLTSDEIDSYRRLVARRLRNVPVAYLVGYKEFMGLQFAVNENVLIPRPETEHLVEAVSDYLRAQGLDHGSSAILDMCTGCGAVAVSIAVAFDQATVVAVDASLPALRTAQTNAAAHDVGDRVHCVRSDMFDRLPVDRLGGRFNVVVSNPPYLSEEDLRSVHPDVARSEPLVALDGGKDGLRFYRILADHSYRYLQPGGLLALEIGASQGSRVVSMLRETEMYEDISVSRDFSGLDRVITACRRS